MSSIEQQVKAIVAEQLGVKEEEVTNDASFVDDLGADSLDTVELVMALEEEVETEIPDEDAEKITTVQQAIDYITARRNQACAGGVLRIDTLWRSARDGGDSGFRISSSELLSFVEVIACPSDASSSRVSASFRR